MVRAEQIFLIPTYLDASKFTWKVIKKERRKEREKGGLAECFAITYQAVPIKRV